MELVSTLMQLHIQHLLVIHMDNMHMGKKDVHGLLLQG